MEAIRASTTKVAVFCQAGNILVPRQANDLIEFVDHMVHPVRRARPGHLFHPKLWLLRFESETGDTRHRLLILTRNLTLDRSWDLILRLDSDPSVKRRNRNNDQLARLVEVLPQLTTTPLPTERADAVRQLANELRYLSWERPDGVNDVRFWAYGIGRLRRPDFSGYRHLVMSPYITEGGLDPFLESPDLTVVSRTEELDRLDPAVLDHVSVYALDPLVGYGGPAEAGELSPPESGESDPGVTDSAGGPPGLRDLHAKMYVAERSRRAHLFVGSANATDAAFAGNVELLCEVIGGRTKLGVSEILDTEYGMGSFLQAYAPRKLWVDEELERLERQLEELLRVAAELVFRANVKPSVADWTVELITEAALPTGAIDYVIAPLNRVAEQRRVPAGSPVTVEFGPRPAADITAFYLLTATLNDHRVGPRTAVVRAELRGAPSSRFDEIIARQVDTPEKFMRFILLLLGSLDDLTTGLFGSGGTGDPLEWRPGSVGIFELLTNTLATRPEALDDLATLVDRLNATDAGRSALPDGWAPIWDAVMDARSRLVDR
jgi:hypothetical protein